MIKRISDLIAIPFWVVCSTIWILSQLTSLEITNKTINTICLILTISGVVNIIVLLIPFKKKPKNLTPFIMIISLLGVSIIISIWEWKGDYKTQTVLYDNGHFKFKTIEFQMRDNGSLGYDQRIVEVTRLTSFLKYIEPIDTSKIDLPWIKVDKEIK